MIKKHFDVFLEGEYLIYQVRGYRRKKTWDSSLRRHRIVDTTWASEVHPSVLSRCIFIGLIGTNMDSEVYADLSRRLSNLPYKHPSEQEARAVSVARAH
jgi:hypothetical protein